MFAGPPPSKYSVTFARSFAELLRNFRENMRKHPYSQTLAISKGRIEGKANIRGLGAWMSQSLTFGNLAAAFGACLLRLQKAPGRKLNQNQTEVLRYPSSVRRRRGAAALYHKIDI